MTAPAVPPHRPLNATAPLAQARGAVRLAGEAVVGVVDIVEGLHQRIASLAPPLGRRPAARTRGITGFVYRRVRGTTVQVQQALDAALAVVAARWPAPPSGARASAGRDRVLSALNGVVGDHLHRTGNPLAIEMTARARPDLPATPHLLVLVHGLCMSEHDWLRDGHDHGAVLATALGATPVDVRYNTGRAIGANGRELSEVLDALVRDWPVPVRRTTLLCHSMGGLVARSACHHAEAAGAAWRGRLADLVFLGTPHHGAALERAGNRVHRLLGISPYLAPFARLSGLRSEGITDLRHGNVLQAAAPAGRFVQHDTRVPVPLPRGVRCFAVAGTQRAGAAGDGLVSVDSALGRHPLAPYRLALPAGRTWVVQGAGHLALLGEPAVAARLARWLDAPPGWGARPPR